VPVFPAEYAGLLTISFNKDIDTTYTDQAKNLELIFISNLIIELFPLTDVTFDPAKDFPTITQTLTEAQVSLILALENSIDGFPTLSVHEDVFYDKYGNGNPTSLLSISVDMIDEDPPIIEGALFVSSSGVLIVAFNEEIDPVSVVPSGISVREAGQSTGGVTLNSPTNIVSVGDTIEITVSEAKRVAINLLTTPIELDVDDNAFADIKGNLIFAQADTGISIAADAFPPYSLSATYDETFSLLTITFNEPIDVTPDTKVDLTKVFISESGSFEVNVLDGATVTNLVDGNPITIDLTGLLNLGDINAITSPLLNVRAGAFVDRSNNPSDAITIPIALNPTDLTPPVIQSVEFDESFGLIRIQFDEDIDSSPDTQVDLTKVFISESGGTNENVLTGASVLSASRDSTVEIGLNATQITFLTGLTSPELDVSTGAFLDENGNPVDPTPDTTIDIIPTDITKPQILSVVFDNSLPNPVLTITFDEEIDASSVDLTKVFVSEKRKRNQNSLTGAVSVTSVGNTIIIDTTASQEAIILALTIPELDVGKNAFTDLAGNRIDKVTDVPIT